MIYPIDDAPATHDFMPFVTLNCSIEGLAKRFKCRVAEGADDLDSYRRFFARTAGGTVVLFISYAGIPVGTVDVFVPLRDAATNPRATLVDLLRSLDMPLEMLVRMPDYMVEGGRTVSVY